MTTICASKYNNEIVIAADRRISFGDDQITDKTISSKIISFKDAFLGIAGSSRVINIFDYDAEFQEADLTTMNNIFNSYNMFSNIFEEKYHFDLSGEDGDVFHDIGFSSIVINNNGVYSISHGCEIVLHENFWAIGSGSEYCLGAMALYSNKLQCLNITMSASDMCKSSIEAAALYDYSTSNLLDVKSIKL